MKFEPAYIFTVNRKKADNLLNEFFRSKKISSGNSRRQQDEGYGSKGNRIRD